MLASPFGSIEAEFSTSREWLWLDRTVQGCVLHRLFPWKKFEFFISIASWILPTSLGGKWSYGSHLINGKTIKERVWVSYSPVTIWIWPIQLLILYLYLYELHLSVALSVCVSCSVASDSLWHHGLWPAKLLCSWNSPGKNTGVGSLFLLQGIFPTQGLSPCLLHCRQILYCLSSQGSPIYTCMNDISLFWFYV